MYWALKTIADAAFAVVIVARRRKVMTHPP
jgi:hypothetical protein